MKKCEVAGCARKILCKGLCCPHYQRFRKHGSAKPKEKISSHVHGHCIARSPTYLSWRAMRMRCKVPTATAYERYGGRGITICKRWENFKNFLKDMGERPSKKYSLDRINNEGNYGPRNCRWASRAQQARNRRPRRNRLTKRS